MNKIKKTTDNITPGNIFHPGEYIREEIEARDMSQQYLAEKIKMSKSEVSLLIHGRRDINPRIAVSLEKALGIDAEFWMNLQVKYDIEQVKKKARRAIRIARISTRKKDKLKKTVAN